MAISRDDLRWAADQGLLAPGQDEILWRALERRHADKPRFDAANVAYYAGALIVIGAMGWYMTVAWEGLGGWGIATVAAAYGIVFILTGRMVWDHLGLRVPGGLLFTMAVGMTPLFTYGVLRALELWPQGDPGTYQGFHVWIKGSWFTLEIATILAGLHAFPLCADFFRPGDHCAGGGLSAQPQPVGATGGHEAAGPLAGAFATAGAAPGGRHRLNAEAFPAACCGVSRV